jgi:hypothetical protein
MVRRSPATGFSETAAVRFAAMSELGGMDLPRDEPERVPPVVQIAVWSAWALAAALLLFGFIGFLISNAIGNGVGGGAFVLGLIVAGAAYLLSRGNRLARAFIGLGAAATAVACVIYASTGPGSAVIPSLVIAALAAGTFALLYLSDSAKQFYSSR